MEKRFDKPIIRKGWLRAITFFIFYMLVVSGFSWLLQKVLPGKAVVEKSADPEGAKQNVLLLAFFLITLFSLATTWIFRKIVDKKTLFSLGFAWDTGYSAIGVLAATAMLGTGTLILIGTGHLAFTSWNGGIGHLLMNLLLMVLVAVMEEVIFRGYLLNNLLQSMNKWLALAISALLFTLIHTGNNAADVLPMMEIFIAGIMLGTNYIFTRNLWFGISLHFAWNFLQGPVLGYQVSGLKLPSLLGQEISGPTWLTGGAFGFEGSVLAMALNLGLIGLLVWFYQRQQVQKSAVLPS